MFFSNSFQSTINNAFSLFIVIPLTYKSLGVRILLKDVAIVKQCNMCLT